MLPRSRVHSIPAGKAPQRGADAVKVGYLMSGPPVAQRLNKHPVYPGALRCFRADGLRFRGA
jgi:hypothetical protein